MHLFSLHHQTVAWISRHLVVVGIVLWVAWRFPAAAVEAPASLQWSLNTAETGEVLSTTAFSASSLPVHLVNRVWTGGSLVFSDSPEYVPGPGVLYADTLPEGPARLMLYHVNDSAAAGSPRSLQFAVIVEPEYAGSIVTIRLQRKIVQGPSTDYSRVGRLSAYSVLAQAENVQTLTVSAPTLLDPGLQQRPVSAGATPPLLSALYDFVVSGGRARVTIAALRSTADVLATYKTLPVLAREQHSPGVYKHDRGTYPGQSSKDVVSLMPYDTRSGMAHVRFGNGRFDPWDSNTLNWDPWAGQGETPDTFTGSDALLGVPSTLRGNYGVTYTVRLRLENPDGRRVALVMICTGGYHAGAVGVNNSLTGEGVFHVPYYARQPLPPFTEGAVLGRWNPAQSPEITLTWTPAGSFSLPVEWVLIPYPEPGDADGDGNADLRDAAVVARYLTGLVTFNSTRRIAADITMDGLVNGSDVSAILRKGAGLR